MNRDSDASSYVLLTGCTTASSRPLFNFQENVPCLHVASACDGPGRGTRAHPGERPSQGPAERALHHTRTGQRHGAQACRHQRSLPGCSAPWAVRPHLAGEGAKANPRPDPRGHLLHRLCPPARRAHTHSRGDAGSWRPALPRPSPGGPTFDDRHAVSVRHHNGVQPFHTRRESGLSALRTCRSPHIPGRGRCPSPCEAAAESPWPWARGPAGSHTQVWSPGHRAGTARPTASLIPPSSAGGPGAVAQVQAPAAPTSQSSPGLWSRSCSLVQ